tara:strand:- start:3513 stop:4247 length:735 start_codon:yes stop_codon:yes gene_type:complete
MGWASKAGRARTSATNPQAFAICDRCGFLYNHVDLKWQFDWRGVALQNTRLLVCNPCYDTPQEQLRAIIVPADPTPIMNARTENFVDASTDDLTIVSATVTDPTTGIPIPSTTGIVTEDGIDLTVQPIGVPVGLQQPAIMPLQGKVAYAVPLPIVSLVADGTTIITVSCSSVHNLIDNSQISVAGTTNKIADGFYSVTYKTATSFTYMVNSAIAAGSLLGGSTKVLTTKVGIPYNYTQIPQAGV